MNRIKKILPSSIGCLLLLAVSCVAKESIQQGDVDGKYFANGIKIGEVDQDSAILWTRLTRVPSLKLDGAEFADVGSREMKFEVVPASKQLPKGKILDDMIGAVPGTAGKLRFIWHELDEDPNISEWIKVDQDTDYTAQLKLNGLKPGTAYTVRVESQGGTSFEGSFRTAPAAAEAPPVTFAVVTGGEFIRRDDPERGPKSYAHMAKLGLDFFIHTGDIEYYDKVDPYATSLEFARFKMARMYGQPNIKEFHRSVPSYFIKDDHDTLMDDAWPGQVYGELTWDQGVELFREHFPVLEKNYRTIRWGRDLQIWMVEGRDFRSPNDMPDGPDKTIWGQEQKDWFFRTVEASEATFKVLISPTPIVGPDRESKKDNHANSTFKHEGDELRAFLASQDNMYVACGDRHWQYISVHAETGVKEFSCGPNTDAHSGGWTAGYLPEHTYLNVQGGHMTITVERRESKPVLITRHYDVDGNLDNEDINWAAPVLE